MDVISDILPSVFLSKVETAEKDRQRKNKHYKQLPSSKKANEEDTSANLTADESASLTQKTSTWEQTDRRSTNDRRRQMAKRGRWLESRNSKDRRRTKQAISITI